MQKSEQSNDNDCSFPLPIYRDVVSSRTPRASSRISIYYDTNYSLFSQTRRYIMRLLYSLRVACKQTKRANVGICVMCFSLQEKRKMRLLA